MTEMSIFLHFIFSFLNTVGFSVFLNVPTKNLFHCGLIGAIGWTVYYALKTTISNSIFSNFIASLAVAILSELFARKLKKPAILFIIPGIIPLVPGLGMYNTMLNFVQGHYNLAISTGTDTILTSGAIALGLLVTTSTLKTINTLNKNNIKK